MSNNAHWNGDFWFAGPHTTFCYQHFQMVDLMTLNYKRAMNGLNTHALHHEPKYDNIKHMEENVSPSKDEKVEQQKRRINKLMTGYDFVWKITSTHATRKQNKKG